MTLQQLEYIVCLDKCRHFGRAAQECQISQPTLSAMVQKLETELGVTLFERSARKVIPTAIGHMVIAQAREVLGSAEMIRSMIREKRHSYEGLFRLGILPTVAPYLLPRFFPKLCHDYPELDLRVTEMTTDKILSALQQNEIDAAILVNVGNLEVFLRYPLYYEQFLAYVSRNNALFHHDSIKTSDLSAEDLWLLDEGHCFRDQLVKFCQLKSASNSKRIYSLGSMETFMRMVEGGRGVTFIPELACHQLSAAQKELVRPFAIPIPVREIILMTTSHFFRDSIRELIEKSVRKCVPQEMLKMDNTRTRV